MLDNDSVTLNYLGVSRLSSFIPYDPGLLSHHGAVEKLIKPFQVMIQPIIDSNGI